MKRDRIEIPAGATKPAKPKRRRGIINIRPRKKPGDKRFWWWQPCPTINGKKHWGKLFPTQDKAFAEAERLREAAQEIATNPARVQTIGWAMDRSIDITFASTQNMNTRTGYRSRRRRILYTFYRADASHWPPGLETLPATEQLEKLNELEMPEEYLGPVMNEIDAETVVGFIQSRRRLDRAGNGLVDDLTFLTTAFRRAGYRDHENPVLVAKESGLTLQRVDVNHGEHPTPAQVHKILKQILESDYPERQYHHDIVLLVFGTGMRNGEVDRLRPMDIEWVDGDPENGGKIIKNNPAERPGGGFQGKSGKAEQFFASELSPVLARLMVGVTRDGQICSGENLTNICARWAKRLDAPWLNAENLRNTFLQQTKSIDYDTAWRQAGHRDSRMIDRHYTTHDEDRARTASRVLLQKLASE